MVAKYLEYPDWGNGLCLAWIPHMMPKALGCQILQSPYLGIVRIWKERMVLSISKSAPKSVGARRWGARGPEF